MNFEYKIFKSVNGMVGSANGPDVPLLDVLNLFGSFGGSFGDRQFGSWQFRGQTK